MGSGVGLLTVATCATSVPHTQPAARCAGPAQHAVCDPALVTAAGAAPHVDLRVRGAAGPGPAAEGGARGGGWRRCSIERGHYRYHHQPRGVRRPPPPCPVQPREQAVPVGPALQAQVQVIGRVRGAQRLGRMRAPQAAAAVVVRGNGGNEGQHRAHSARRLALTP